MAARFLCLLSGQWFHPSTRLRGRCWPAGQNNRPAVAPFSVESDSSAYGRESSSSVGQPGESSPQHANSRRAGDPGREIARIELTMKVEPPKVEPPMQRPTAPSSPESVRPSTSMTDAPGTQAASGCPPVSEEPAGRPALRPQHAPVWAQRLLLGIEVGISVWTGLLVLVLPWTRLWTENPLLGAVPGLKLLMNFTFVRGMISGVGIVDIWMGVADALHYRDLR